MKRMITAAILLQLLVGALYAQTLRQDIRQLLTYKNLAYATAGLGTAGIVRTWDDDLKGELEGAFLLEGFSNITDVYGSSGFNLPTSAGLWALGKVTRRPKLEQLGSTLLRTLALTQLVVAPIKVAVRRERPDGSNRLSFPSGHAANGFAIARMLDRSYGHRVGIPLYVLGIFVAAGRMEGNRHYLSDVVMGAFLGTIVGNAVTLQQDERIALLPQITADGVLLALRVEF